MNVNEISYMYNSALNGLSVEGTKSVNYEKQIDAAKEALKKAGAEGFSSSLTLIVFILFYLIFLLH